MHFLDWRGAELPSKPFSSNSTPHEQVAAATSSDLFPLDRSLSFDRFVQELLSFTEDAAVEVVAQDKNIVIRLIKKEQPKINQVPLFEGIDWFILSRMRIPHKHNISLVVVIDLDDSVVVL